jgi:hypothetical protein
VHQPHGLIGTHRHRNHEGHFNLPVQIMAEDSSAFASNTTPVSAASQRPHLILSTPAGPRVPGPQRFQSQ